MNIEILEWSTYLDKLSNGESELFEIGWAPAVPDPDMALWSPLNSSNIGNGANFARYNNPEIDKLLEKGRELEDGDERADVYKQVQEIINDECPWIYQYNNEATIGLSKNVQNFEMTPFSYYPYYKASFGEAK